MNVKTNYWLVILALFFVVLSPGKSIAAPFKVLVIMSYDEIYAWEREIREGIENVLMDKAIIKYVYMDTKNRLGDGPDRAKEAYELYQDFQPDGVIAADDNAQSMFVVPYLRDKVSTPVMFCGVNANLADYGYPSSNVSGIWERLHINESLTFAQQLVPTIKKVGYLQKDGPSGRASADQVKAHSENYPVESVGFKLPKTLMEAKAMVEEFKEEADALFFETFEGIPDENGKPLSDKAVIPILSKLFGKPVISNNLYHVEYGTLCAVIKSGQEQGEVAATKLLDAMQGKAVADIPVSMNQKGLPVLNVTVMEQLGITPKPIVLQGVKLVTTNPKYKILVVMSYEEDFLWDKEVQAGIEYALADSADIRYFYMNTKINLKGGEEKAREAFTLYQEFRPDGVIASDDNAQSMFVVPYLKDKEQVPVIFCGVNADPAKYGYPASNVSGILERGHIKESIAFLQELVPSINSIAYMAKESPTGRAVLEQAEQEAASYSARSVAFLHPQTLPEAVKMATEVREQTDVMFLATMQGIRGEDGEPLSEKEVIPVIAEAYGKPIISDNAYDMKYGMFCALAVSGKEQGVKAGRNLMKAMTGTPMVDIPIIRNEQGRRIVNVSVMKKLGITLKPGALIGVELIKTEQ